MLKSDYTSLFMAYESFLSDIDEIFDSRIDSAMEANELITPPQAKAASPTGVQNQNTGNKPAEVNARQAVKDTVKTDEKKQQEENESRVDTNAKISETVKKIGENLKNLQNRITNRNKAIEQTTNSFKLDYEKQKQKIKPESELDIITFPYDNNYLDRTVKSVLKDLRNAINALSFEGGPTNDDEASSDILKSTTKDMLHQVYAKYSKDRRVFKEEPETTPEFIRGMILTYRGEKKQFTYRDTQIGNLERLAMNTRDNMNDCMRYINEMNGMYARIKNLPNKVAYNTDEKVVKQIRSSAQKAAILFDSYGTMVQAYYEAKLEETLSYRAILKRMYAMK